MSQDAESTITAYYDALRAGDSLSRFFAESPETIKVGISERLVGYADVAAGLSEQTATTDDWTVESHELATTVRDDVAWFNDRVTLAWYDTPTDTHYSFETRWTGILQRRSTDGEWQFVTLHVSVPDEGLRDAADDLFAWDG